MANISTAKKVTVSLIRWQLVKRLNVQSTLERVTNMSYKPMKKPGKKKPGKM
jgi:hypothetical protein